tara:strand:- start:29 stop:1225 length:1197 start_codon:yes stop_codon:yes gene_type:complete
MSDDGLLDLDKIADENQLDDQGRRPGEEGYNGTYQEKKEEATKEIQESTTETEKNTNEDDGSEDKDNLDTQLTILVNGETIAITEDFTGTHIQNKDEGHGLHVQKNGDIIILSGSGGKGQACGGRMLINTKNGQIIKSGPKIEEVNASSKSSGEDGSKNNKDSGNSEVAYSGSFSGDYEVEIQGTKYVKARDIVLDATDTITLRGTKVIVEVDEWIEEKGLEKSKVDTIEEEVTAQRTSEVKEDVSKQYDPRASKNTVGTGHINENVQGDYQMKVAGIYNLQIQGNSIGASPLIKNRSNGLNIGLNNPGVTGGLCITAKDLIKIGTTGGSVDISANENVSLFAVDDVDIQGMMNTNVLATDGKVTVKGQRVKVETTGGDIEIEAKTDVKVTGQKIYLN